MSYLFWSCIGALLCLACFAAYVAEREAEAERDAWQLFVDSNSCHVVEKRDAQSASSYGPSIGFDGKMTMGFQSITIEAQECWLCANGKKYWKKAGLAFDRMGGAK
ncbi:hypothetical protein EGJ57_16260 [Brucella anthropi]|uniref:hypothetical protein n=1 Tax=Brucella anthropi TaxID=529 RepID=UPI000F668949|nr:hypothetical protein [Brucella anthropi]RRY17904.1 hypothetical protein EGJ57_16260 [Brucella anthropi]